MKNFDFFVTDSEDTLRLIGDIERKGIPKVVINPEKVNEKIKPLNVFMLSPTSSYAGLGGAWMLSSKMAQEFLQKENEFNNKYIESINFCTKFVECFNIFNSAGGGTGSGAGPIFLEYLKMKSTEENSRKLYTTSIVLPFNNESGGWREVNASVNIARYSKLSDGILVADNQRLKNSMKLDIKGTQEAVNKLLSNVWMWMNACSNMHLNVSPKRWEGADFKRSFKLGAYSTPIVPCYREEPKDKLKRINMKWIVLRTIKENCAAECLPQTSKRILVIISIPENMSYTSLDSDLADYISEELFRGKRSAIDVIFIRGKVISISVTVLLVAPIIPRLAELENNFKVYLEDSKLFERDMIGQFLKNS